MDDRQDPTQWDGWLAEWTATRRLTYDLLEALPYSVMNFSPDPSFGTLIRQIRHAGDMQASYLSAIASGRMDFSTPPRQRRLERSKDDVAAYLTALDADLRSTLAAAGGADPGRTIDWGEGDQPSLHRHLMRLLQHETLHHGMWAFYAKIADLPLPESWRRAWMLT